MCIYGCVCCAYVTRRKGFYGIPHRGQVAHGHVQSLNWVERDLQPAADQSLLQQAPWHLGQPTDRHLEDSVFTLTWNGYLEIHLEKEAKDQVVHLSVNPYLVYYSEFNKVFHITEGGLLTNFMGKKPVADATTTCNPAWFCFPFPSGL